jgi:hypothetical protein
VEHFTSQDLPFQGPPYLIITIKIKPGQIYFTLNRVKIFPKIVACLPIGFCIFQNPIFLSGFASSASNCLMAAKNDLKIFVMFSQMLFERMKAKQSDKENLPVIVRPPGKRPF